MQDSEMIASWTQRVGDMLDTVERAIQVFDVKGDTPEHVALAFASQQIAQYTEGLKAVGEGLRQVAGAIHALAESGLAK